MARGESRSAAAGDLKIAAELFEYPMGTSVAQIADENRCLSNGRWELALSELMMGTGAVRIFLFDREQ